MPDETRTQQIERALNREVSGAIELHGRQNQLAIAPRNMAELFEFAKLMAISKECVRPQFRDNPGACLAIALQAFRTGADPFAIANQAYIVNDQISYQSAYINALINTSPQLKKRLRPIYSGQGATRKCLIRGEIRGEDEPFEYESPEIKDITTKNSPLWKADPDQQLFYYASRAWARRYLPEVTLGLVTSEEASNEMLDVTPPSSSRPPRPEPEDFTSTGEAVPPPPLPPPAPHPPYFWVDGDGIVHEHEKFQEAVADYADDLIEAAKAGEVPLLNAWRRGAQLLDALRRTDHVIAADALGAQYSALLADFDHPAEATEATESLVAEESDTSSTTTSKPDDDVEVPFIPLMPIQHWHHRALNKLKSMGEAHAGPDDFVRFRKVNSEALQLCRQKIPTWGRQLDAILQKGERPRP